MERVLIITGGSKGIGAGIIQAYQQHHYRIFSISRSKNESPGFDQIEQIQFDLSKSTQIEQPLKQIFAQLVAAQIEQITLINNAGTLGEIGRLENLEANDIENTVQLNAITPLTLSAAFIQLTKTWSCTKKIINISSGAAHKPYYGWTVYCATKAALDMMTKTIAVEQSHIANGVKIIAIYPGVVDTEMQGEIRKSKKEDFLAIDRFLTLKTSGGLANAKQVGEQIFAIDQDENIENGSLLSVESLS